MTEDKKQLVVQLYEEGHNVSSLADLLKISKEKIKPLLQDAGVFRGIHCGPKWETRQLIRFIALKKAEGMSHEEVASRWHCKVHHICSAKKNHEDLYEDELQRVLNKAPKRTVTLVCKRCKEPRIFMIDQLNSYSLNYYRCESCIEIEHAPSLRILLVYNETRFFVLERLSYGDVELLKKASIQYLRSKDETPEMETASRWIEGRWKNKEITVTGPLEGRFDLVVIFGHYL